MLTPGMYRFLSVLLAFAVVPLLAVYALLYKISMTSPSGGMEPTMAMLAHIAITIIFGVLTVVVISFSRQLSRQAKGKFTTP